MEEARQYTAVMSGRLVLTLGIIKIVQLLSALSALVLAFTAPDYMFASVIVFGIAAAIIAAVVAIEGLIKGRLLTQTAPVTRAGRPLKFWGLIAMQVVAVLIGLALTQIWRLAQ